MQAKFEPPKLKILAFVLLLIVASLTVIPMQSLMAQSCGTGEQVHRVASGENLYRIGLRYGVSMEAIAARNGITDYTRIYAGTNLCIPAGSTITTSNRTVIQIIVENPAPTTTARTTSTKKTVSKSVSVPRGEENWCYTGGPWDDGRCIVPGNPALQDYWFLSGWCNAQVGLGNYRGTVDDCLNGVTGMDDTDIAVDFSLVDRGDDQFACTIVYDKQTGKVSSFAKWDEKYEDQSQIIFFTNLPGLSNYAVSISETTRRASITKSTESHRTFSRASGKISIREDGEEIGSIGPFACERIET